MEGVIARVEAEIRRWVQDHEPGDQLPSERDLCSLLSVSRTSVRLVLTRLTHEGLIYPEHGRGYFVSPEGR